MKIVVMEHYSPEEFYKLAGVSRQRLHQLWEEGRGPPFIRVGNGSRSARYVPIVEGTAWLYSRKPRPCKLCGKPLTGHAAMKYHPACAKKVNDVQRRKAAMDHYQKVKADPALYAEYMKKNKVYQERHRAKKRAEKFEAIVIKMTSDPTPGPVVQTPHLERTDTEAERARQYVAVPTEESPTT